MRSRDMSDVTRILNAIEQGDTRASDELLPLVYEELCHLIMQKLSQEKPGQTLRAAASWVRLPSGIQHEIEYCISK